MPNPNPAHNPTDGLNTAAFVQLTKSAGAAVTPNLTVAAGKPNPGNYSMTLSLSGVNTSQLVVNAADVNNQSIPTGTQAITSVAAGTGVYAGTFTGGAANAFVGLAVTIAGFTNAANNGTFMVTASTATSLTVNNSASVLETHAATAAYIVGTVLYKSYNNPNAGTPSWYKPSPFTGYTGDIVSVSSTGLITGLAVGQAIVEVSVPVFDNSLASAFGLAGGAIYTQVVVTVNP